MKDADKHEAGMLQGSMGTSAHVCEGATETGTRPQDGMMTRGSLSALPCECFQVSCRGARVPWEMGALWAKGAPGYRSMEEVTPWGVNSPTFLGDLFILEKEST